MSKTNLIYLLLILVLSLETRADLDSCVSGKLGNDPTETFVNSFDAGTPEAAKRAKEIKELRRQYGHEKLPFVRAGDTGIIKLFADETAERIQIVRHGASSNLYQAKYLTGPKKGQEFEFNANQVWKWDDNTWDGVWGKEVTRREEVRVDELVNSAMSKGGVVSGRDVALNAAGKNFGLKKGSDKIVTLYVRRDVSGLSANTPEKEIFDINRSSSFKVKYEGKDPQERDIYRVLDGEDGDETILIRGSNVDYQFRQSYGGDVAETRMTLTGVRF